MDNTTRKKFAGQRIGLCSVVVYIILPAFILFIAACDRNRVYEQNFELKNNTWNRKNALRFYVRIPDKSQRHNIYINIRNTGRYAFSNLFVFQTITAPDGFEKHDTIECILADETGKWLGKGLGDIWDNQVLLKKNVLFPDTGTFVFTFEQAMRVDHLNDILDVGLRVEKCQ